MSEDKAKHGLPGLTTALVLLLPCLIGFGLLANKIASDKTGEVTKVQIERCNAGNDLRRDLNRRARGARGYAYRQVAKAKVELLTDTTTRGRADARADLRAARRFKATQRPLALIDCEAVIRPPG